MKNIIERIAGGGGAKIARYLPKAVSTRLAVAALAAPSARAVAMLLAVCVIGLAKADTMTVMGDDVTICSSATSLDQLGIATLTGTINFYTPSGCSAGDKLVFTKLEMLESGGNTAGTKQEATTISITVNGVKYTSSPVVKSSAAPSSLGNLTTIGNYKLLTYTFPNVIVEAGSSYGVSFNGSGLTELRCRMESTASGTVFTAPASGNWKPYGVITAAPVLASTPVIGSRIILGNTGTSGAISDSGAGECNISLTIPAFSGLPVGSVVRVKNVSLAGWNDSFTDWDTTNKKSDPYFIKINNIISKSLQGTTADPGSAPSIDLTVSKIQANDSTTLNRLFFEYANTCDLTVGTSYAAPAQNVNSAGTGLALCYRNGNLIFSSTPKDVGGVRYVEAATASVLSSTAATGAYPIYEMLLEVVSKPTQTATIDAEGSYTLAGLFSGTASDGVYVINVNESATLNIDAATTVDQITFNVAAGKTLTLTGNTLTASEIAFTGEGVATTQNMSIFSGTLSGDGTLCYDMNNGTTKPSGIVCTSDNWAGMLWIKNGAYTGWNFNTASGAYIKYGSANSTLRIENVTCYLNATETVGFTLDLHGEGLKITNGNGYKVETVKKLTGSGTLAISGGSLNGNGFIIQDGSEFAGSINITTGNYVVNFADSGTYATSGKIIVESGKTATVASGKTWSTTNQNGIEINGTLTLADSTSTLTGAISGSGTLVANQQVPVPGSSFTGTLSVAGGALPTVPLESSATAVYGSVLNISGAVYLSGNVTTLPGTINIASGAYLMFGNAEMTSLALTVGTWDGMLYIADQCTALETLTVGAGTLRELSSAKFAPGSSTSLSTVNIVLDEVKGDGGTITLTSVTGLTAVEGRTYNFTVNCLDGRTVAGTYDSATSTITYTPSISGAATAFDATFTNTTALAYKMSNARIGTDSTSLPAANWYTASGSGKNVGLYLQPTPYLVSSGSSVLSDLPNIQGAMSFAVVGQMPTAANTIFIHMGSSSDSRNGLILATTSETDKIFVGYNTNGMTIKEITTMTVPNSTTARHVYIITKKDEGGITTFTVYLDGIKWKTVSLETLLTFSSGGVQVGADFGGAITRNSATTGYYNVDRTSTSTEGAGYVNVMRLYDRIITSAEIAQYSDESEYPYVSPNGASSRTFATAEEDWVETTDTDWANTSGGTTTQGTAPSVGASVTVTAAEATEITVNLANDTQYEALTINGSAVALKKGTNPGKLNVTGMTVVGAPVTVEYGAANFTGGPMTITEDGSIAFDYSSYDISGIYTTTDIPLTSDVEQNDTKVTLTAPTATYQTASLVYTSGHYAMRVTPVHEAGTELYYKSGYFGKNAAAGEEFTVVLSDGTTTAPVFPGDIVVIDSKSSQDPIYVGELPDNVSAIRIDRTTRLSSGNASIAMLAGATVTVGENGSLTIFRNWNEIHLGNVVLNGTSVSLDQNANGSVSNGQSATLSVSGAVSGTAVLTISGTVNVASGGSIANAVAGSGTIAYAAIPATRPSSYTGWTGTVALPAFTGGEIALNNYGVAGSTVRVSTSTLGYLSNATVLPTIELGGDWTLPNFPASFANEFTAITGSGTLTLDATLDVTAANWYSNYSAFLKIGSVAGFSGSITLQSNGPGIVIGGAKPAYREPGGKILVYGNVTVGETATWTAPNGVILADANATLVVPSGATVPVPTTTVPRHVVKATTVDGTTTYSVVAKGFFFMTY